MRAAKVFPTFDKYSDLPDHDDSAGVEEFLAAHAEFYRSDFNAALLIAFLELHGGLPFTKWNLEIAYNDLRSDGLLEKEPPPAAPEVDNSRGIIRIENLSAEYVPSDVEAAALAKLNDDPNLSDHARKTRDRKLALLAGKQRRAFAEPQRPDDRDPQIVI
jgi:hypothetical protein